MRATKEREPASTNRTVVERRSDRELVVTRTVNGPARLLFEAWTKPEIRETMEQLNSRLSGEI